MENEEEILEKARKARSTIHEELSKVIVGQKNVIDEILLCLFTGSHCLLTGVPGLAKTLLVSSIAKIFDLKFNRIQFTPDLMPADVTGLEILEESQDGHRHMKFVKGPIFANVILADEINRTPPKTQSSLLEAMQEHQVTAAGETYKLDEPFFVLATQNPIEMEGTYPLPEAQLDRFMFNIFVDFPELDDEIEVIMRTTSEKPKDLNVLYTAEEVIAFSELVRQVPVAREVVKYAVQLAASSRPTENSPSFVKEFVHYGAGIRAGQYLIKGAKAKALLDGKNHVSADDVKAVAHSVLRHRLGLSYKAEAQGMTAEGIVSRLLEHVDKP